MATRTRSLLQLLRERDLRFEIVLSGPVPHSAPSIQWRQGNHVTDSFLVIRRGQSWAVEFWDSGYVCRVLDFEPDREMVGRIFESVLDHQAFAYCPIVDLTLDQSELFLNPPVAAPARPRPAPRASSRRRLTSRELARRLLLAARENVRSWSDSAAVRLAWLVIGVGCGLVYQTRL